MIAFIKSGALKPPTPIRQPPPPADKQVGFLSPSFAEGAAILKGPGGVFRLDWAAKEPADRRRALPPGEYVLTGYWLVRRDAAGSEWYLGASGRPLQRFTVKAGEEQVLQIAEQIKLQLRASAGDSVSIHCAITADPEGGLSVYRDGKRVPLRYRLLDAAGKELAGGAMEYG